MRVMLCGLALFLSACTVALDPTDDETFEDIVQQTRAGNVQPVHAQLAPSLQTPESLTVLEQLRDMLRNAGEPCDRTLVRATTLQDTFSVRGGTLRKTVTAQHQYVCPNATLIVDARLISDDGAAGVVDHYLITPIDAAAARSAQTFDLLGKTWRHYAFLVAAIASVLLMLIAFVGVIFTKGFKRKWLWAVISLLGVSKLTMDWNAGSISTYWLSINLLGFGVLRDAHPLAPWVVSFTPPIGALVVLSLLWPRWIQSDEANAS